MSHNLLRLNNRHLIWNRLLLKWHLHKLVILIELSILIRRIKLLLKVLLIISICRFNAIKGLICLNRVSIFIRLSCICWLIDWFLCYSRLKWSRVSINMTLSLRIHLLLNNLVVLILLRIHLRNKSLLRKVWVRVRSLLKALWRDHWLEIVLCYFRRWLKSYTA